MENLYRTLHQLDLIDKDDLILYLSSQPDIIDKIEEKKIQLRNRYYLCDDMIRIIQRFFRYMIFKYRVVDVIRTNRFKYRQYVNTETFLGVLIDDIPDTYFFSYIDQKHYYAFDIRELDKIIDYKLNNPYNNNKIPDTIKKHVKRLMRSRDIQDIINYIMESIPIESNESAKIASVFNELSKLYVYPNIRKFMNFSVKNLVYYIQDIKVNELIRFSNQSQ